MNHGDEPLGAVRVLKLFANAPNTYTRMCVCVRASLAFSTHVSASCPRDKERK